MAAAVILPAYQPDETLIRLVKRLWVRGYSIVVVDDGSGEAYERIFEAVKNKAVVLKHEVNRTIIRNGVLYRNQATDMETLVLNWDGSMKIYPPGELDGDKLVLSLFQAAVLWADEKIRERKKQKNLQEDTPERL